MSGAEASLDPVQDLLRRVPFFRGLDRVDVAKLAGALEQVRLPAGTRIFSESAEADSLYLLSAGSVQVTVKAEDGERPVAVVEAPGYFGELGLLLARRTGSVYARTDVEIWTLPRSRFDQTVRERGTLGLAVAASLARMLEDRSRTHAGVAAARREPDVAAAAPRETRPLVWRVVSAAAPLALPLALWPVHPPGGLSTQGWHVSVIVLGAALGWLLQPAPDFVIALAMAAAWGLAGLVPVSSAFAGFSSPTWVLAFGAVGLAAAMARSGLLFRLTLLLLGIVPPTYTGQVVALLAGGVLTTPVVPMAAARVATTAGLAHELSQALGYTRRGRASAGLAFSGLIGYTTFSSIFLTGLATNFFVLGLLPPSDRMHIGWFAWFANAAPVGLLVFGGALVALLVLFRPEHPPTISTEALKRQRRVLGPLSGREIVTIGALAVLLVGLLVEPVVHVDVAWLAMVALAIVLAGGVLDGRAFRSEIGWGFLVLFGLLVGSGAVFHGTGIDRWIARGLSPLAHLEGQPALVVALLGAFVAGCRLVLPRVPANFLLSLALIPAAPRFGLSPWLVGFIVLTVGNTWLLPNLSDFYVLLRDGTRGEMFNDADGFRIGIVLTVLVVISLVAAVPYWRVMGLVAR
jgi:divalent anion:Na+ symporter, DASS family